MKTRLIRCILDSGGVAPVELDETIAIVRELGPAPLPLDGWDRASVWGWDESAGSLYALLRRNSEEQSKQPPLQIGPDNLTPAITCPETLAQHIAMAVG